MLGDLPAVQVEWADDSGVAVKLEGSALHLEFAMHGTAELYSYWFV